MSKKLRRQKSALKRFTIRPAHANETPDEYDAYCARKHQEYLKLSDAVKRHSEYNDA